MAVPTPQIGIIEEVTYGTRLAPTRFTEFLQESIALDVPRVESKGMRPGNRILRSYQWAPGAKKVAGDVNMEIGTKGFGLWFKHMFGAVATTQPDVGGNPTVYDHTFSPGDLVGKSLTVQVGRVASTGTVVPFDYLGCKVEKWEMGCKVGEMASLKLSLVGMNEDLAQTLASASYATNLGIFVFTQGTLTVAGSGLDVHEFSLTGENSLKTDRYKLGSALMKEPLEQDLRPYTGELSAYFDNITAYQRFTTGAEASLVLDFVGALISGTYNFELKVTANVRFDGDTPSVSGPGAVDQPLKYKVVDTGSTSISLLYRTTDTVP